MYVAFPPSVTCVGDAVTVTVTGAGVAVGDGVTVGLGVGDGLGLGVGVGVGEGVGIAEQSPGPAVLSIKPETVPLNGEDRLSPVAFTTTTKLWPAGTVKE